MGKVDDMRRLREQQFADGQKRRTTPREPERVAPVSAEVGMGAAGLGAVGVSGPAASGDTEPAQPTRPTRPTSAKKKTAPGKSGDPVDELGKCPVCGKMKPLSNGVLANHQKGFGKACAGSRKKAV